MTLKQPEYINCDQTIKVPLKEEEQMGFKGKRKNLIIRRVFIKVASSLPLETAGGEEARTCLEQACLEAKR